MSKNIILIGAGGHCKSCIDVIEQENKFQIIGVVDKTLELGEYFLGYPVLGNDNDLPELISQASYALVTVGQLRSFELRNNLFNKLIKLGYQLPIIISPLAYVAKDVSIGAGTIVMHGAILNRSAKLGINNIINSQALVEHGSIIGDHCHISTKATINGDSMIGSNSFVGSHCVIIQDVMVPEYSFLKANTLYKGQA